MPVLDDALPPCDHRRIRHKQGLHRAGGVLCVRGVLRADLAEAGEDRFIAQRGRQRRALKGSFPFENSGVNRVRAAVLA